MLGAIFGDIAGSAYEFNNTHDYNFTLLSKWSRPTDDSCMTLAVAKALMETYGQDDDAVRAALVKEMRDIGARYPNAGYGGMFAQWLRAKAPAPYRSFGNGSAMRVSPAGWLYRTLEETLHAAALTAEVTHNHPEGIKGAQAVAAGIFLARAGADKEQILNYIADRFRYDLFRTLDEIRPNYRFYETCQKSVPEAIIAFYEGENFEDVIRKAVSLGGDSDTIACMAGAIAEAYYGMPEAYRDEALSRLDCPLRSIAYDFRSFYRKNSGRPADGWQQKIELCRDDPFMKYNPVLEAALDRMYEDPGDLSLSFVLKIILASMERAGRILIPIEPSQGFREQFDRSELPPGDTVQTEEKPYFRMIPFTDADGTCVMPVFTSRNRMEADGPEGCSTLDMYLEDYMKTVLEMGNNEGLLINPGKRSFFINTTRLEGLLRESERAKTARRTPGKDAEYTAPENFPEGLSEIVAEFAGNNFAEIEKIWLAGIRDGGEDGWCFAVKADAADVGPIFDRLQRFLCPFPETADAKILEADAQPSDGAQLIYDRKS